MSKAVWACASIFDFFLRYEDNRCFSVSWRRSLIVQIRKKPFQSPEAILKQEKYYTPTAGNVSKIFGQKSTFSKKPIVLSEFKCWQFVKTCQKLVFKVNFLCQKSSLIWIFQIFSPIKNYILGAHFLILSSFYKSMPIFYWTFGSAPRKLVNPIPTGQGRNQPLYERHVTKSGRNRVKLNIIVHYSLCFGSILMWIRTKDAYLVEVQSIVRTRSRWPFKKARHTLYFSLQSLKEPSRLEVIINGADMWKLQTDFFGRIWTPVKACLWPSRSPFFCPSWRLQMPAFALSHPLTKIL